MPLAQAGRSAALLLAHAGGPLGTLHAVSPGGPLELSTLLLAQAGRPSSVRCMPFNSPGGPLGALLLAQAGRSVRCC